ncbi:hypothetical protein Ahy_B02g060648 [Arachis hypogaea]|uniref:Pyruvate carboxyltransferase domain-containing protein n=1 Tax=Arachis hypogaea TaxID=3818 RepID=A0A445AJ13_ARAHY|nr:hypothetical protein Ahy_B02g060648 [Arachis hypogaea]
MACISFSSETGNNSGNQMRPHYKPNHIPDPNYVRILDTTLRDGEQSPGAAMTPHQKLNIARQLAKLGVDVIEAGFPCSSKDDFAAVKMIAQEVGSNVDDDGYVPVIAGVARCNEKDIEIVWEAVKGAKRPRISTFIATSEIHMKHKLKKTKEEVLDIACRMVMFARSLGCDDVQFVPEDAARSEKEFLYEILGEVIKAGATTIDIPDTVGIAMPWEFGKLIADIKTNTHGIENVVIVTHCHNDLGLAVANTIMGARAGARQLEVTMNGIGERAGNAALEEVVMALKCSGLDVFDGLYTTINTEHILNTSKMVEEYTNMHLQPHKALVGANAFIHESGIHQLGYRLKNNEVDTIFWKFKAVADKKKRVTDADLRELMSNELTQVESIWKLGDIQVTCGTLSLSTATIRLNNIVDGSTHVACSVGSGSIYSVFKAVNLIVKV